MAPPLEFFQDAVQRRWNSRVKRQEAPEAGQEVQEEGKNRIIGKIT